MSEFDVFPPTPVMIEVGDESLEITPIRVGELSALIKAVRPFIERLTADTDWIALLADHNDALLEAIAIASRRQKDWVSRLTIDDAVRLATVLFEVNADFFTRQVSPAIQRAAARINEQVSGESAGREQSSG